MPNFIPKLLSKWLEDENTNLEDLNADERETFFKYAATLNKRPPTVEEQVNGMNEMVDSLIMELVDIRTEDKNDTFLKARIKNYILLRASLETNEKAKLKIKKLLKIES